jgi:hypothetical protein
MVTKILSLPQLAIKPDAIIDSLCHENKEAKVTGNQEYLLEITRDIMADLSRICNPQYGYELFNVKMIVNDYLEIDKSFVHPECVTFNVGSRIASSFAGAESVAVFVSTAGNAFEHYMRSQKDNILKEFITDAIGSEIPEAVNKILLKELEEQLKRDIYELHLSNPYSPGYCGWDVAEQQKLFSLLPPEPCGIKLNASSLMAPLKSVSGIIAIGKNVKKTGYKCDECDINNCTRNFRYKQSINNRIK